MFTIDIKINGKSIYIIEGKNLTPRGPDYKGICAYEVGVDHHKITFPHARRSGLLRLCGRSIYGMCREIDKGRFTRKMIECK